MRSEARKAAAPGSDRRAGDAGKVEKMDGDTLPLTSNETTAAMKPAEDWVLPSAEDGLGAVLEAWQAATIRLEKTHEALRAEVKRLTDELERKNRQLARKDRLADLGRMAAHIAHELRNSLVPVALYVSLLRRHLEHDEQGLEILECIAASHRAAENTVTDLLQFAADREPCWEWVEIGAVLTPVVSALRPQAEAQGVEMIVQSEGEFYVRADREMLRRAVFNLVLNALDAMPRGGRFVLRAVKGAEDWRIEAEDEGPGLPEEGLRRAFEPFYTTKKGGTGLGLAIVQRIAELHGGEVDVVNRAAGGARFTLSFPHEVADGPTRDGPSPKELRGAFRGDARAVAIRERR